jgi:PIN domain nuclease of toxin-antitoxin system
MRLLLDTHAFLWAASEPSRLGPDALRIITDPGNERLLSYASVWEMSIKYATGKLILPQLPLAFVGIQMATLRMTLLRIELPHLAPVATLPPHHRDPFDRLLVAQAMVESVPIVSADAAFDAYGVTRLW